MWPSVTFDVRPVNVTLYVNTFVDVSSVAVNVPLPVGLPARFAPISPAGVRLAVKCTIFDGGVGFVVSLPPQAASTTIAVMNENVRTRVCIGSLLNRWFERIANPHA